MGHQLPVPSLTATVLPAISREARKVVVHGSPDWRFRAGLTVRVKRVLAPGCKLCGERGHNRRSCARRTG